MVTMTMQRCNEDDVAATAAVGVDVIVVLLVLLMLLSVLTSNTIDSLTYIADELLKIET